VEILDDVDAVNVVTSRAMRARVVDAVRDCWVSLYSPPAMTYRARLGEAEEPAMGVAVQLMVAAEVSGVMFTCNPVTGGASMGDINAGLGFGLALGQPGFHPFLPGVERVHVPRRDSHCC